MKTIYRGLLFLGFSTGYFYLRNYLSEREKSEQLERDRLNEIIQRKIAEEEAMRAQNAFLMAQINPHFFFNTLDYFYHSLLKIAPELADAVSSLAGMMRFAINADKIGGLIRLGDEVEQVENLIYLHQVRQQLHIRLDVAQAAEDLFFIPLIVLTLTENIFKHGNLTKEHQQAHIRIAIDQQFLVIETHNLVNTMVASVKSNTGLLNMQKRLATAYPNNFHFEHGSIDGVYFNVKIRVALSSLNDIGKFSYP
ncbi:histidine kinase [Mucilaginibacter robiniae]|uniref:Histidine kinase n=1 Tax=Mucilaginibacter robiniae TaxID=2728022 RepID=A0A7L5DZR0_9SPHI|nr:sensor histidine kinase [Mucilaginibacter robiniae]QJD96261.1 histidine kinase [Mucilaginibacter robiniae]